MAIDHTPNWPGWQTVRCLMQDRYGSVYEIHRQTFGEVEKAALKVITIPHDPSEVQHLRSRGYDESSIRAHFYDHCNRIIRGYAAAMKMKGHSNIVYCDDQRIVPHADGIGFTIYIKMELLTPLSSGEQTPDPVREAVMLGRDLCRALIASHGHSVLHGNIHPRNIFRTTDGRFKLGDFGIAGILGKATDGACSAPEALRRQGHSVQTDIYSLGMIMYWILNYHRMPFLPQPPMQITPSAGKTAHERRISGERIPAPALGSEALKRIVLKACTFEPSLRYTSAAQMLEDLQKIPVFGISDTSQVMQQGQAREQNSLANNQTVKRSAFPWIICGTVGLLLTVAAILCSFLFRSAGKDAGKETDTIHIYATTGSTTTPTAAPLPPVTIPSSTVPSATVPEETILPVQTEPEDTQYQTALEQCAQWGSQGDFISAVIYLEALVQKEPSDLRYSALLADYQDKLVQSTLAKAQSEIDQLAFPQAYQTLRAAKDACPSVALNSALDQLPLQIKKAAVVSAGKQHTVILHNDGTVSSTGSNKYGQQATSTWSDIVMIGCGDYFTIGLRSDGKLEAVGRNRYEQCDVTQWEDVVCIAVGDYHTVVLFSDGKLDAKGYNDRGQTDVYKIMGQLGDRHIVDIAAGYQHTVALLSDGSVIAIGSNEYGQLDVTEWSDVIAIYAGSAHTVGLRSDGSVVATGKNVSGQCDVDSWQDIRFLCAGDYTTFGIRSDGSVLACGLNDAGQKDTSVWKGHKIVAMGCGNQHCAALTDTGYVICAGNNDVGQCGFHGDLIR